MQSTIRERIARCGKGTVLLQVFDVGSSDNDVCLKRSFVERFVEIDLVAACAYLGIETPSGERCVPLINAASKLAAGLDEVTRRGHE